jgi:arylsulfatase A-like enzyme
MADPNIVLVHCHDLGRHLGCHGRGVETPHIDALARDGVRFDRQFCTAPQCSPSRGSLLTGTHPQRHGLLGLSHLGWDLDPDRPTLPELLSAAGYTTQHVGMREDHPPGKLGFEAREESSTRARDVADLFADLLPGLAEDSPFLASLGFSEPHRPYEVDYVDEYDYYHPENVDVPPYLPDSRGVREDVAALNALVTATVDRAVGRIRESIERAGVAEETVVVFTTDHGLALPRAKGAPYDPGIEAALIVSGPGFEEGAVRDELLSNVDVMPTLLACAGVEAPADLDGRSFLPLLEGEDYDSRERVFASMTWHDGYNPMRVVRSERYKYVRSFADLPRVFLPGDVFRSPSGRELREQYYTENRPAEELYDLRDDPEETENLLPDRRVFEERPAGNPPLDRFRGELRAWMESVGDPLLDGPVPAPGAHDW